ncbi:MAG: CBS domain-containing protein, partial [bacterium]|nr:CBS domain-containing protein [bacterium]
ITPMNEVVNTMDVKKFGLAIVTDDGEGILGVITDGDLRRNLLKNVDFSTVTAFDCMTPGPLCIGENNLAVEALKIMEERHVTSLVVAEDNIIKGLLHLHDLWRTEMI